MFKSAVATTFLLICNVCAASDLSGFWQHPKDPVWLDINESLRTGIAVRNDDDPSSIGFAVLKGVVAGPKQGQWSGQVYVPQLGAYKQVTVTLPDANTLKMKVKIGIISRSLEWSRVSTISET